MSDLQTTTTLLTIGHSPDPDDAFMWWPLGDERTGEAPSIDVGRFRFRSAPIDIETLNRRAIDRGDLDITAISMHTYPFVRDRYALTSCGASMGDGYGPKIVARADRRGAGASWLLEPGVRVAIPGLHTTANLTLRLLLGAEPEAVETPFDRIIEAVSSGEMDAGVVIHEGQLTFADAGLVCLVDLGEWWLEQTGLPLPLGANAVRRDLDERFGEGTKADLAGVLSRSIEYALSQRSVGIEHAMSFARGIQTSLADRFISMYVNDLTLDAGERGAEAIRALLTRAAAAGLCPDPGPIDLITPPNDSSQSE